MMKALIAMYEKGAITADHLVSESMRQLDPACPEVVLDALPPGILDRIVEYVNHYRTNRMKSNYGISPTPDQIQAARQWLEVKVEK